MRAPRLEKAPRGSRIAIFTSITPGLTLFALFFVTPIVVLTATAFARWNLRGLEFNGLDNYITILGDQQFWYAVVNSGAFVLAAVLCQVPLAVLISLILARAIPGWKQIRLLLFLPNMMSAAAIGLLYLFVFNPRFGLINGVLRATGLGGLTRDWLADVDTALWSVIATWVFSTGLYVVLLLNEIQSLPVEIQEAAQLDGANRRQREWWITLPLIRPVIGTCMLLAVLVALAQFEGVYVMTRGGPADRTMTLGLYSYLAYSRGEWGLANAVGLLMLVIGAALILLIRRVGRLEESPR